MIQESPDSKPSPEIVETDSPFTRTPFLHLTAWWTQCIFQAPLLSNLSPWSFPCLFQARLGELTFLAPSTPVIYLLSILDCKIRGFRGSQRIPRIHNLQWFVISPKHKLDSSQLGGPHRRGVAKTGSEPSLHTPPGLPSTTQLDWPLLVIKTFFSFMKNGVPQEKLSACDRNDEWVKLSKKGMVLSQKIAL